MLKQIRISDANGVRTVSKIAAAVEVCLNKALKGDIRALEKIMKIAEKLESFQWVPPASEITRIRRIIVDPGAPNGAEIKPL